MHWLASCTHSWASTSWVFACNSALVIVLVAAPALDVHVLHINLPYDIIKERLWWRWWGSSVRLRGGWLVEEARHGIGKGYLFNKGTNIRFVSRLMYISEG